MVFPHLLLPYPPPPKKEGSNTLKEGLDTNSNTSANESEKDYQLLTSNLSPLVEQFKQLFSGTIELGLSVLRNILSVDDKVRKLSGLMILDLRLIFSLTT